MNEHLENEGIERVGSNNPYHKEIDEQFRAMKQVIGIGWGPGLRYIIQHVEDYEEALSEEVKKLIDARLRVIDSGPSTERLKEIAQMINNDLMENPRRYEDWKALVFNERGGFVSLSRVLSYKVDDKLCPAVVLHLPCARTLGLEERGRELENGFRQLAIILGKELARIQTVLLSTWAVGRSFARQYGFHYDVIASQITSRRYDRQVHCFSASREKFLEKWGRQKVEDEEV